jgi:hypothetical protein
MDLRRCEASLWQTRGFFARAPNGLIAMPCCYAPCSFDTSLGRFRSTPGHYIPPSHVHLVSRAG